MEIIVYFYSIKLEVLIITFKQLEIMSILLKIKENKNKVSKLEKVSIETMGIEQETDKNVTLVLLNRTGDPISVVIPKNEIISGGNKNETYVSGKYASENLFNFVNKKYWM